MTTAPQPKSLSQGRAADREQMVTRMAEIAARHGATITHGAAPLDPRGLSVRIGTERAYVAMTFTAKAEGRGGWGYLGHWVCMPPKLFKPAFQGSYSSPRPHHKATAHAETFEDFAAVIDHALGQVVNGDAFDQSERTPR